MMTVANAFACLTLKQFSPRLLRNKRREQSSPISILSPVLIDVWSVDMVLRTPPISYLLLIRQPYVLRTITIKRSNVLTPTFDDETQLNEDHRSDFLR